jgi:hypothetical protein
MTAGVPHSGGKKARLVSANNAVRVRALLTTIKGDKVKGKIEIEEELKNVIKDIESVIGEGEGFISHLNSTRQALEWVLEVEK